jgi:hypothetical protein
MTIKELEFLMYIIMLLTICISSLLLVISSIYYSDCSFAFVAVPIIIVGSIMISQRGKNE